MEVCFMFVLCFTNTVLPLRGISSHLSSSVPVVCCSCVCLSWVLGDGCVRDCGHHAPIYCTVPPIYIVSFGPVQSRKTTVCNVVAQQPSKTEPIIATLCPLCLRVAMVPMADADFRGVAQGRGGAVRPHTVVPLHL